MTTKASNDRSNIFVANLGILAVADTIFRDGTMKHKACTAVFSDHHFVGLFYRPVAYHLWHHLYMLLFNCGA